MEKLRVGVIYFSAGQKVAVERGFKPLGHTTHDASTGQQTFRFKSLAEFAANGGIIKETPEATLFIFPKEVFEMKGINTPIPFVEVLSDEYLARVAADAAAKLAEKQAADDAVDFDAGVVLANNRLLLPDDASEAMKAGFLSVGKDLGQVIGGSSKDVPEQVTGASHGIGEGTSPVSAGSGELSGGVAQLEEPQKVAPPAETLAEKTGTTDTPAPTITPAPAPANEPAKSAPQVEQAPSAPPETPPAKAPATETAQPL